METLINGIKEFFGWGGYTREPEGFMSFEHLAFVTSLMIVMIGLAVLFGLLNRNKDEKIKNRVLIVAAILIDACELFKIVYLCFRGNDPWGVVALFLLYITAFYLVLFGIRAIKRKKAAVKDEETPVLETV